jgi:arylsulfatase A-like enzyme
VPTRRQFLIGGAGAAAAALSIGKVVTSSPGRERPNVLVIVVDTLRADYAYGPAARTPAMDALGREGVTFERVFPEAMPTVPARNSILSGRRMFPFNDWHDHRGLIAKPGWAPLDPELAFTTMLRRAGYWTGYVTDNPFLGFSYPYEPLRRSFDLFVRRGGQIGGQSAAVPERLLERWLHPATIDPPTVQRVSRYIANADYSSDESQSFAARVFSSGLTALDRAARKRPFALVVDTFQPHEPWTPPPAYLELNGAAVERDRPQPAMPHYGRVENWLTDDQAGPVLSRMRALYAASVSLTDRWLGRLLERLYDHGLERETAIVLVADHGFQLGERGWTGKVSVALHPELIQVPLILVDPERRRAGDRSSYFASTHDLARTVLRIAGVRAPRGMRGVDLTGLFEGREPPERPYAYGGYSNNHFLRSERWAYMSDNRLEHPLLFDLEHDPGETVDVGARFPDVVEELSEAVRGQAGGELPYYES